MSKFIQLFIIITLLSACGNSEKNADTQKNIEEKEEQTFFPVTDFLLGQLRDMREVGITPIKLHSVGQKEDTTWVRLDSLKSVFKDFLNPGIDSIRLSKNFKVTKFFDQTLNFVTLMYEPLVEINEFPEWLSWTVYIDPEKGKVKKLYFNKKIDKEQTQQLMWESGKSCTIRTFKEDKTGNTVLQPEITTIKWRY